MTIRELKSNLFIKFKNHEFSGIGSNVVKLFLFLITTTFTLSSHAIEKETIERLKDEDRVLSSALELHVISSDSAIINGTISLNHDDAWLFFDNIQPSEVIANYTSNILINGETLSVGANGRVSMYAHGTVIMPFSYGFKPLTVYTEEDFSSDSTQLKIDIYHNKLGVFDNAIKSFKLKRGYMATFANNADGTGYSRVFIAADEDLVFNVMPAELYGAVSFIRVFEYEWVSKKGKAGWNPNDINATSYYDWNIGGNSSENVEYVAIRQNGGWPSWNDINSKQNVTHLLGFNEPDHTDQANMTLQQMIDLWPEMMKSGFRIGSPAWANPWGGFGGTLFDFINKCDELNYRVDFVALHCYWGGKSPQNWYNDLKQIHEQTGRPLWITEWNNGANWTNEWWPDASKAYTDDNAQKQLNDIKEILQVLDTASFIERYFIYDWVQDCRAMVLNGELTKAGEYYAKNKSQVAFNKDNEMVPHWRYKRPELSYRYFSLNNSIRVSWNDSNGELSREYIVEKKVNDGLFESIYSSNDISKNFYLDPLDSIVEGNITYRVSLKAANGIVLRSNEVSYYQTAGSKDFQFGSFSLRNTEINTSYYSTKYPVVPLVLLGISTFNNDVPFTRRVNATTTTSFNFKLDSWLYVNNPKLTKSETLAVLSIPAGSYEFGELKAESKSVTGITRDWIKVNFDEEFDVEPVVFCTIASNGNSFPLTVGVRNVSNSGFEICVKSEEAVVTTLIPEKINYLAIQPGSGVINGKRITVGRNYAGSGISSMPLEITFDSSYTEPAIFAGLLTNENDFASTLHFSKAGDSKFILIRQRELSGGVSDIKEDDYGWMIMDFATDQTGLETSVNEHVLIEKPLNFYPNPAQHTIYFDLEKPTSVEIFDLTGNSLMKSVVSNSLNITSMAAGIYILKVENKSPKKLFISK